MTSTSADRSEIVDELRRLRESFGERRFSNSADILRDMRDERAGIESGS